MLLLMLYRFIQRIRVSSEKLYSTLLYLTRVALDGW